MGPEIYWNIRASSPSVRQYLTLYFRGDRSSQSWHDVFTAGQSIDLSLEEIYRRDGYGGVCRALETDDKLEHWLTRVAAQITYQITGDSAMFRELQSSRAPGESHLLPSWALAAARDLGKAMFQQQGRVKAFKGGGAQPQAIQSDGDGDGGSPRRPRRRPRNPQGKANAAAAANNQK